MAVKRAKGPSRLTPVRRSNSHDSGYSLQPLLDLPCALAFDDYIARLLEKEALGTGDLILAATDKGLGFIQKRLGAKGLLLAEQGVNSQ